MTNQITICVLANQTRRQFRPFTGKFNPSLLPLLGKPLLAHVLELVHQCDPERIVVVVEPGDLQTRELLERVRNTNMLALESHKLDEAVVGPALAIRADVVPDAAVIASAVTEMRDHGANANLAARPDFSAMWPTQSSTNRQVVPMVGPASDHLLPTASAYFRVALAAELGRYPHLIPGGSMVNGIRLGLRPRILTRRLPGEMISIGDEAFVERNVQLDRFSIIGDRAYVGRGAWIRNAIVLPHAFVPAGAEVRDAVVCGSWCFHIPSERVVDLRYPELQLRLEAS